MSDFDHLQHLLEQLKVQVSLLGGLNFDQVCEALTLAGVDASHLSGEDLDFLAAHLSTGQQAIAMAPPEASVAAANYTDLPGTPMPDVTRQAPWAVPPPLPVMGDMSAVPGVDLRAAQDSTGYESPFSAAMQVAFQRAEHIAATPNFNPLAQVGIPSGAINAAIHDPDRYFAEYAGKVNQTAGLAASEAAWTKVSNEVAAHQSAQSADQVARDGLYDAWRIAQRTNVQ
jgi:hypothetical protein